MSKEVCSPFSNGSEAMDWYDRNCERCTKAYFPKVDGDWPSDKTMRQYCSIGKECKLKYHLDIGFITGEVPVSICQQIGMDDDICRLKQTCLLYSDNDDDGYKPKPRPKPDGPLNQMCMPFIIEETLKQKLETV